MKQPEISIAILQLRCKFILYKLSLALFEEYEIGLSIFVFFRASIYQPFRIDQQTLEEKTCCIFKIYFETVLLPLNLTHSKGWA